MNKFEYVYILPDIEGGVTSIVYNLTRFSDSNLSLKVILLDTGREIPVTRQFPCETIKVKIDPNKTAYVNAKRLLKHINSNSIIISNDGAIEFDMIELFGLQNPVIYILHGDFQYYYDVIRQKHHLIDTIITYSEFTFENTKKIVGPENSFKVKKIYYPVPEIKFFDRPERQALKIIFAGWLTEGKGARLFPAIVERLNERKIPFEFTILGDGPLKKLVRELDNQYPQVTYLGQKSNEQVLKLMLEHDVFFLPSDSEGLPVAIVEAMKSGLITVASNIKSGIPDVIFDGETGFKINVGDVDGIVNAFYYFSTHREKLHDMSKKSFTLANSLFNSTAQSREYLSAYNEAASKEKSSRKRAFLKKLIFMLPNKARLIYTYKIEFRLKKYFR